jgi:hypothetical protein
MLADQAIVDTPSKVTSKEYNQITSVFDVDGEQHLTNRVLRASGGGLRLGCGRERCSD